MRKYVFKKWHIAAGAVVLLFIIGLCSSDSDIATVEASQVERGQLKEEILCSGKIRPVMELSISPDVSGEIVYLGVSEGSFVHKGDTLLKIRQDIYLSMVERARATVGSLEAALLRQKANMLQAELDLQRAEKLFAVSAISKAELESARTGREMMKGQLDAAAYDAKSGRAALSEAMENLTKTVIVSPTDGTVSHLNVELGERVVGTSQMAGTEIMRIADFGSMEVVTEVGENDVVKIQKGQSAKIEIDALKDLTFKGFVTKVANSSKIFGAGLGQVANFEVRIAVDTDSDLLRPGMSASASIITSNRMQALKIPVSAIFVRDGKEYVWKISEENRVKAERIRTGIQDMAFIEVTEGLGENDRIVTGPHSTIISGLKEDDHIRIQKK